MLHKSLRFVTVVKVFYTYHAIPEIVEIAYVSFPWLQAPSALERCIQDGGRTGSATAGI